VPAADRMFDFLIGAQADYMQLVIGKLGKTAWAKPLIADIETSGGLKSKNMAKLRAPSSAP
jgi:hypothetical protein